ncbi:MAG TPA: hypothetical protein ENH34_01670 [Phycisphaerales bacterium]|nr:hypothetical protein [Phycisphaerales bacterium]
MAEKKNKSTVSFPALPIHFTSCGFLIFNLPPNSTKKLKHFCAILTKPPFLLHKVSEEPQITPESTFAGQYAN